jgi:DNA-binding transcriptional MerR regulator
MSAKADDAFRTISEVSEMLGVPSHVLRFWETKFSTLRPLKRSGGRRYYRPADVQLLERIRDLLYSEGFTIKGAQKHLSDPAPSTTSQKADLPRNNNLSQAMDLLTEARTSLAALRVTLAS